MRLIDRLNCWAHGLLSNRVLKSYRRKSCRVEVQHPQLFAAVAPSLVKKHRDLWQRIGLKCGDRWLRLHVNLTGIEDYTFCPEDIFFAKIERVLNECENSGFGPEEKNDLFLYVPEGAEPETIIRYVRGNFFDGKMNWLSDADVNFVLGQQQEPVVCKPCRSSGGAGVSLRTDIDAAWIRKHGGDSFIVQRKIKQGEFAAAFNKSSVNTVRMMTLRCPWNGEIVVCRSMMRLGVSDAVVDNMMKGGLCVCIGDKGQLGKYAYDYDGKRFTQHPVSGLAFDGLVHPGYEKMVEMAKKVHKRVSAYNLLSFDLVQRDDGSVCVVEINSTSQGITQLQYDFGGLFGVYTERLVDWIAANDNLDRFKHFRTWY